MESTTKNKPSRRSGPVVAIIATAFAVVGCAGASFMSRSSATNWQLSDGKLRTGPDSPNWVSSELPENDPHYVAPFTFEGDAAVAWKNLVAAIEQTKGTVEDNDGSYLHAIYVTRMLRFRDDLEARLDAASNTIHIRSGSRVGQHDTGTNRRRTERLRQAFTQLNGPESSVNK
jgi:uncharacterized protein (DUF1499 family)